MLRGIVGAVTGTIKAPFLRAQAALWTEAVPEQQRADEDERQAKANGEKVDKSQEKAQKHKHSAEKLVKGAKTPEEKEKAGEASCVGAG